MTHSIDQTLHQLVNLLPNWTLLPILTLLPNFGGFHRTLQRVRLANRGRLLLRTPGPVPFGTCICSNVETILSWTCHVYGPFEFRTSLGTSILLKGSLCQTGHGFLELVLALFGHYFSTCYTTCLAKDHWRGFSTQNTHMVHIVNLFRLKMVYTSYSKSLFEFLFCNSTRKEIVEEKICYFSLRNYIQISLKIRTKAMSLYT